MRAALLGILTTLAWGTAFAAGGNCGQLATLTLPHTRITLAEIVPAGAFTPAKPFSLVPPGQQPSYKSLPAFCRVAVQVSPVPDSLIKFELWLPVQGWNGRFLAVGNGGLSGEIFYPEMIAPLTGGYATASTDTGHEGSVSDASFALGHPQKLIDNAYRAVHQMAVQSKAIIRAYYRTRAVPSYWSGCSTGGGQGLMEAQRFPADFNGIIAGDPVIDVTHLAAARLAGAETMHRSAASFLPPDKLLLLHAAVLKACDALDGVTDGVIADPLRCKFDPGQIECTRGRNDSTCLTAAQVETARTLYAPLTDTHTHAILFPRLLPGSESDWGAGPGSPTVLSSFPSLFGDLVFQDPHWDYRTVTIDQLVARADHSKMALINAIDPNLRPFFVRGGKLIQYHGWADPDISPLSSVDYYLSVARAMGDTNRLAEDYRLFMVPGMNHCRGGDGTDQFEAPMLTALEQWVEHGRAPDRIIASRVRGGHVDRTRPLCAYPEVAVYKGSGSTDQASSFACQRPR